MRRVLLLLIIGCIALVGAELTKLQIRQEIDNQRECDWLSNSCEYVIIINER